jgi:hypothetical protein
VFSLKIETVVGLFPCSLPFLRTAILGCASESEEGGVWYQLKDSLEESSHSLCGHHLVQVFCFGWFNLLRGLRHECIELQLSGFAEDIFSLCKLVFCLLVMPNLHGVYGARPGEMGRATESQRLSKFELV